jgi:hypothetical protein
MTSLNVILRAPADVIATDDAIIRVSGIII